jgi:PTH1 family peptidyl-tRNA hydrolase
LSDTNAIRLIVGLGNPGQSYDQTRHNAGFWFVDELCERLGGHFRPEAKFFGQLVKVSLTGHDVWLLKPMTYMNRSGQSLSAFCGYFKILMDQVLIVHDEIDLPPGTARLKRSGGHGGHNGLRDVIAHLGREFWRLRLGVGHPGHRDQVTDYVLSRPTQAEAGLIRESIEQAADVIDLVIAGEMEKAMHRLHSKPKQDDISEKDRSQKLS